MNTQTIVSDTAPHTSSYRCWVEIDTAAISSNIEHIKTLMDSGTKLMVMVKSDAYGHGVYETAKIALEQGASYLGVCYLEEARYLRNQGITSPIMLFTHVEKNQIAELFHLNVTPGVYSVSYAQQLSQYAQEHKKTIRVHVELETGLQRTGIISERPVEKIELIAKLPGIYLEGIYTQFADATNTDPTFTKQQEEVFMKVIKKLENKKIRPKLIHAANSSALAWYPSTHYDMVRVGAAVYGLQPSSKRAYPVKLTPALSWKSKILFIKTVKQGTSVGYRGSWIAKRDTIVATVSVGYTDGLRRAPQNAGVMLCKEEKAPIIGNISMNHTMIDVTDIPNVMIGDEVVLIGSQGNTLISAQDMAESYGTIYGETITSISKDIPKVYMKGEPK